MTAATAATTAGQTTEAMPGSQAQADSATVVTTVVTAGYSPRTKPAKSPRKENSEFAGFVRRMIRAHAKRCTAGDPTVLADMIAARNQMDEAIATAVAGLHARGFTWEEIGNGAGMARNHAWRKWGKGAA